MSEGPILGKLPNILTNDDLAQVFVVKSSVVLLKPNGPQV